MNILGLSVNERGLVSDAEADAGSSGCERGAGAGSSGCERGLVFEAEAEAEAGSTVLHGQEKRGLASSREARLERK